MTQIIEIENDLVRIVNREIVHSTTLAAAMPYIENRPAITMFHPRSAILTQHDESNPLERKVRFLCELPPGLRAIVKLGRRYRLAIPWTYFVFSFRLQGAGNPNAGENWSMQDHAVFHAPARVSGLDSRLWSAFLPNVYEDGRICFGSTGVDTYQPLVDRVDQLVNEWYSTEFNNDVHGSRAHPLPFNGTLPFGWRAWVDATRERGLSAYMEFPEWNVTDRDIVPSWTVGEILTGATHSTYAPYPADRVLIAQVRDQIPAIETPWTFGRMEEWFAQLEPTARFRLMQAAANFVADNADAMAAPEPPPVGDPNDDGGEDI